MIYLFVIARMNRERERERERDTSWSRVFELEESIRRCMRIEVNFILAQILVDTEPPNRERVHGANGTNPPRAQQTVNSQQ